jgi:hypothetical protein
MLTPGGGEQVAMAEQPPGGEQVPTGQEQPQGGQPLAEPTPEEIKHYDLEILSYAKELDREEIDYSTVR